MSPTSIGGGMLLKSSPWFSTGAIGFCDFYVIIKRLDLRKHLLNNRKGFVFEYFEC